MSKPLKSHWGGGTVVPDYPLTEVLTFEDWGHVWFQCRNNVCELWFTGDIPDNYRQNPQATTIPTEYMPPYSNQVWSFTWNDKTPSLLFSLIGKDRASMYGDGKTTMFGIMLYGNARSFETSHFIWLVSK